MCLSISLKATLLQKGLINREQKFLSDLKILVCSGGIGCGILGIGAPLKICHKALDKSVAR